VTENAYICVREMASALNWTRYFLPPSYATAAYVDCLAQCCYSCAR